MTKKQAVMKARIAAQITGTPWVVCAWYALGARVVPGKQQRYKVCSYTGPTPQGYYRTDLVLKPRTAR